MRTAGASQPWRWTAGTSARAHPLIDHTTTLYPCWSLPGRSGRRFTAREPDVVDRHLRPSEVPSQLGRPRRHHLPRTAPRRRQLTRRHAVSPGHPTPFGGSIPCGYSCPTDSAPGFYLPSRSHSPARSSAAPPPPPAAATPTVRPRAGYDAPTAHSLDARDVGANQPISIIRLCGGAGVSAQALGAGLAGVASPDRNAFGDEVECAVEVRCAEYRSLYRDRAHRGHGHSASPNVLMRYRITPRACPIATGPEFPARQRSPQADRSC